MTAPLNAIAVSIGSNVPQQQEQVVACIGWLKQTLTDASASSTYCTPAVGGHGADYTNCVVIGKTAATIQDITAQFKAYERQCGRTPECKALGLVPIDLDVVIFNGEVVREKDFNQIYFKIGWEELQK